MKYLCLLYGDPEKIGALSKDEFAAVVEEAGAHDALLQATGQVRMVESLEWSTTTLRAQGGETVVTDGPFVETREKVGSVLIIEARDLNDAIRVASLHPTAKMGEALGWALELRPIADVCHQ